MSGGNAIDLSTLAAPTIVDVEAVGTIKDRIIANTKAYYLAATGQSIEISEPDPLMMQAEAQALNIRTMQQEGQDGGLQTLLAYATGANLDQIGANYNCPRKTGESDIDFRQRIPLSLEAISTAGSRNSYKYHALSVEGVADVSVTGPDDDPAVTVDPGHVVVTVLATATEEVPTGVPDADLLSVVEAALNSEDVRPLTDAVTVQAPTVTEYSIAATLYFYSGPDRATVLAAAQAAAEAYRDACHKIGYDISLSGIYAALHQPGVSKVILASPAADIPIDSAHVSHCTVITLTDGGIST